MDLYLPHLPWVERILQGKLLLTRLHYLSGSNYYIAFMVCLFVDPLFLLITPYHKGNQEAEHSADSRFAG